MTVRIRVVAAVFRQREHDRDRILACRRAPGKSQAGKWEFPGGKVEPGETPESALAREIREELEVEVAVGEQIDRSATPVGDVIIDLACFEIIDVDRTPTHSSDHDVLQWLTAEELGSVDWAAPDLPAVEVLRRSTR